LSIPKFSGKENADEYLKWAEQCDQIFRVHNLSDQRCVNLASVEFSVYALTLWNQVQENQLQLGLGYIHTWEEMKRVMKRRFVPSSYERDLMNRMQTLRQGKRSVDEYFKEMELLLVRTGTRESMESKMARFLGGLNEGIAGFVEMFPYHTLQDLVDQAMRTERKIQQESCGRSYGSHSIAAPWRKQQFSTSFGGEDLKVVHLNLFHQIVHQRWPVLVLHRPRISSDLLPVQQHPVLPQVLHLPLVVGRLCAISATDVGTL
jgi:hypothetical protein